MKIAAKITMAKRKFASGPATTMAALFHTRWKWKLTARSPAFIVCNREASGALPAFSSPKNFT